MMIPQLLFISYPSMLHGEGALKYAYATQLMRYPLDIIQVMASTIEQSNNLVIQSLCDMDVWQGCLAESRSNGIDSSHNRETPKSDFFVSDDVFCPPHKIKIKMIVNKVSIMAKMTV